MHLKLSLQKNYLPLQSLHSVKKIVPLMIQRGLPSGPSCKDDRQVLVQATFRILNKPSCHFSKDNVMMKMRVSWP